MNKVILIGNLGADPDVRTTPQGTKVCKLRLATSESYKDKSSGEWKELTEWHSITLWDYLAEKAEKNLHKGSKVCIEGKNKTNSYEKDGVTHYRTEVQARDLILLDPKQSSDSPSNNFSTAVEMQNDASLDTDNGDDIPF